MPVILALTITLVLPGYGERTATIERPMPSMERCIEAGNALVDKTDAQVQFVAACRLAL